MNPALLQYVLCSEVFFQGQTVFSMPVLIKIGHSCESSFAGRNGARVWVRVCLDMFTCSVSRYFTHSPT